MILRERAEQGGLPPPDSPDLFPLIRQMNQLGFKWADGDYLVFDLPELAMALDLAFNGDDDG